MKSFIPSRALGIGTEVFLFLGVYESFSLFFYSLIRVNPIAIRGLMT